MTDKILEMFFQPERWEYAINKGVLKDIKKSELISLASPETRKALYVAIKSGKYEVTPPHIALIPKDTPGEFREVHVNEPIDRVVFSIANDLLFDLTPDMVHPRCYSYLRGTGTGKVVKDVSKSVCETKGDVVGFKSDLSKYFDSVPIQYIDEAFDKLEAKYGKSKLVDVIRKYYHSDWFFDVNGNLKQEYKSLKQGCAVASWLADVILYHIDEKMSKTCENYWRYCDDMLVTGKDYEKGMTVLTEELGKMGIKLNPKKVEYIKKDKWFKFLGYSIKGSSISLSKTRLKNFQKEIEKRTFKSKKSLKGAINSVNNFLYKGNGEFSWATAILPVCNVKKDIMELDKFVLDCLRAVETGKHKIGGLGYVNTQTDGCIVRGKGRNVKANRSKVEGKIEGYYTLGCMQKAIITRRAVYNTLVGML